MIILSLLLSLVFFTLGGVHFHWVAGGTFGFEQAIPTKADGAPVMNPKRTDSAIVGIGLLFFGIFYLFKSGLFDCDLDHWVFRYGGWIVPSLFLLRAIGDFRYVGFFKKITTTEFAKWDTRFFSPLCLAIGLVGIVIQLWA